MYERPDEYENEIEYIQNVVGKHFPVYKTEIEYDVVSLYIKVYQGEEVEDQFDDLRKEMVPKNYIPHLKEENGEFFIKVKKKEEKDYRGVKTNLAMFLITIATTLIAGTFWWSSYRPQGGFFSIHNILNGGFYFSLPLMTILGIHELGHYFTAKHHDIEASLPFFIPAPPPLGTIGAFISMRDPIPDNKSLLDVGIAGPLAGITVAIPVSIIGLWLGDVMPQTAAINAEGTIMNFNFPFILQFLSYVLPLGEGTSFHPTLFAGWVGFLVTGLNLLPAGQLDGGHVVRALFEEKAKYASYGAVAFLVVVGIWQYYGWLIFAFFILFLVGLKHPPPLNDFTKLDNKRKVLGVAAIVVLLISFRPVPIEQENYQYDFDIDVQEDIIQNITVNGTADYTVTVTNTGSSGENYGVDDEYNISYSGNQWPVFWYVQRGDNETRWDNISSSHYNVELEKNENVTLRLVSAPDNLTQQPLEDGFNMSVRSKTTGMQKKKEFGARIIQSYEVEIDEDRLFQGTIGGQDMYLFKMPENSTSVSFNFSISNGVRNETYSISTESLNNESWSVRFNTSRHEEIDENISLSLDGGEKENVSMMISRASTSGDEGVNDIVKFTLIIEPANRPKDKKSLNFLGI